MIFNTSAVPSDASLASAKIKLYLSQANVNAGGGTLTVRVLNGAPTYPHSPVVVGDFDRSLYSGNGGERDFRADASGSYYDIDLNSTGRSWINKGGTTRFQLQNVERDIDDSAPGNDKRCYFGDGSAGKEPKLEITYSIPSKMTAITSRRFRGRRF